MKIQKSAGISSILAIIFVSGLIGVGYWIYSTRLWGPQKVVTVGPKWVNQAQFAGIFVANERGIYAKRGLEVEVKEFDFETDQLQDLLTGKTDFALVSAEEFLLFIDDGYPIKAVAAIYQVSPYAIVSLAESGVKSPADFSGMALGVKGGKLEEELFYRLLLSSVGLTNDDASIKKLGFDDTEAGDLTKGSADTVGLYRTDQLYFFDEQNIDYNIILPEQYGVNAFNDILITREDLINTDPKTVENFVKGTIEGWEEAINDPEGAVDDTLKYVTNDSYKNRDYELYILNQSIPLIKPSSSNRLGYMSTAQWRILYERMLQGGFVNPGLNVADIFTIEFLP